MDIESAYAARGSTRFQKMLSVLVGVSALLAALLATLHQDASRREEQALVLGARLSVDIFEATAGSGMYRSFSLNALRDVSVTTLEALARGTAGLDRSETADTTLALAQAYVGAEERIFALAEDMGRPPATEDGVHPHTVSAASAAEPRLVRIVEEQNAQVDAANRYGEREDRAVLALSLLAVAAVLLALAGVSGRGRTGRVAMTAAAGVLVLSVGWGTSALFLTS
jgi:hypothetical protein